MNSKIVESQQTLEWWKNMALALQAEFLERGVEIVRLEQALEKAQAYIDELEAVMLDWNGADAE